MRQCQNDHVQGVGEGREEEVLTPGKFSEGESMVLTHEPAIGVQIPALLSFSKPGLSRF